MTHHHFDIISVYILTSLLNTIVLFETHAVCFLSKKSTIWSRSSDSRSLQLTGL